MRSQPRDSGFHRKEWSACSLEMTGTRSLHGDLVTICCQLSLVRIFKTFNHLFSMTSYITFVTESSFSPPCPEWGCVILITANVGGKYITNHPSYYTWNISAYSPRQSQ